MIVVFNSSETGELMIMADLARVLLKAIGKECIAKGVIMQYEKLDSILHTEGVWFDGCFSDKAIHVLDLANRFGVVSLWSRAYSV